MNVEDMIKGKKIIVIGLARSGVAVAKLLHRHGASLIVNDSKPSDQCPEADELIALGIEVICGGHPPHLIHPEVSFVVKNPGIPYHAAPLVAAAEMNIPVFTEIEVASWFMEAPIVGITGSNGKTTTTSLLGEILEYANFSPIVGGNIGVPLSEIAPVVKDDQWVVAELSSFQLKGTRHFRPRVAVLLNIFPAHLDYHGSMADYEQSKAKLFANQLPSDVAILNADNAESVKWKDGLAARILLFSRLEKLENGVYVDDGYIVYAENSNVERIMRVSDVSLKGVHNLENVLAAICAAVACNVDKEAIAYAVAHFSGVEHRLEFVRTVDGVKFFNDSKATNPTAAMMSIDAIEQPIVWIAGGLDRGTDFMEMLPTVKARVKAMVCYGQSKDILFAFGKKAGLQALLQVDNVSEAVDAAKGLAKEGDVVLLSPACASWDMYPSFEVRGRIFKESVHNL